FNDETLARTVFAGTIPLISAVGHETDTTLIDFVSDRRAPTPTAAAEMATPVLAELRAGIADLSARLHRGGGRAVEDRRGRVENAGRALGRVPDLVEMAAQRFNLAASRLGAGLSRNVAAHHTALVQVSSRLSPGLLLRPQEVRADRLGRLAIRLRPAMDRGLERAGERLTSLGKLYASVNPDAPLKRGFARVERLDGSLVRQGGSLASGEGVRLVFADQTREATIDGTPTSAPPAPRPAQPTRGPVVPPAQGDLF
ncbi:exodeoxyribonuclease VII large subunit, partial [Phenylobacterium sp.]|uniref:exodeoxyribonuclease VII large subunit n=1 Tax=Phenylobacterium sp. TaxID=1871053 RepID=UPI002FCA11AF